MVAKNWLGGNPPVRRNATNRALPCRVDPEGPLCVGRQWLITAELQIEQIVHEAITSEADNLLRVDLVDEGASGSNLTLGTRV